jgi:hypothetical protein
MKNNTLDFIYCYEYFKVEGKQILEDIKKSMINANIYENYIDYELSEKEEQILIEILNEHCYLDIIRISNFMYFIRYNLECGECLNVYDLKYYEEHFDDNTTKCDLYNCILSNDIDTDGDLRLYYYNDMGSYYRCYEEFSNSNNIAILEAYIIQYLYNNDN